MPRKKKVFIPVAHIYLSSTKYPWWNFDGKYWKDKFKLFLSDHNKDRKFDFDCFDPLKQFDSDMEEVVAYDKFNIGECNYFVCYLGKLSIGTLMELMHHYVINNYKGFDKDTQSTCVLIDPTLKYREHPWIKFHCPVIVDTAEDAAKYVYEHMVAKMEGK